MSRLLNTAVVLLFCPINLGPDKGSRLYLKQSFWLIEDFITSQNDGMLSHLLYCLRLSSFIAISFGTSYLFLACDIARANEAGDRKLIASIYLSETLLNEQIATHLGSSDLVKSLRVEMDSEGSKMLVKGLLQLPFDDYESMGIDPKMTQFHFQLSVRPTINNDGYLVLEFPLRETYFYQATSKNPNQDRIVLPVQLVSLGVAAARSYFAALSGDYSSFDRKLAKLQSLKKLAGQALKSAENEDARKVIENQIRSLDLQMENLVLQKEQFQLSHQSIANILGLMGEKQFNLNNQIKATENTIFLKLKLDTFLPYLKDVELAGIRIHNKDDDGRREDYFAMDIKTLVKDYKHDISQNLPAPRRSLPVPPALVIRLKQELFLSKSLVDKKQETMGEMIKDFKMKFKAGGLHITGKMRKWLISIPFEAVVDFVSTEPDLFEVRLRKMEAFGLSLKFLSGFALKAVEERLAHFMEGVFEFRYLGKKDESQVLQVRVNPAQLIPAFPNLHLMDIEVMDKSFLMRIGRKPEEQAQAN